MLTLFDLLERLNSLQRSWLRSHEELAALPPVQLSALYYLARCNHYSNTPMAVADYLGLTKGTVSQSLKKLESNGLIARMADVKDRRSVRLQLTDKARELMDALFPPAYLREAQQAMGNDGDNLLELLTQLLRQLQKQGDAALFGECHRCRYHQRREGHGFCGLTHESLPHDSERLICREFA
ncbi:MarR family winged helix-turn-helix transcriptional regulator [Serratia sp. AKBS12]|uniref:MarR family winged helix-turn-helix transcriptional regulator n=1 Tax=Serratia sp. AKBS12 TaxID=2974597 RepID=UPI0021662313|nr:MarR family transcriptional regulator [Serratia sp. AKBS12]MCS3407399.1 MarR family transcriptional regulator [Serratia sp. AKBS12]HEI8868367.1 MarR family transcriptional regulator [Serratia odorifera]